MHRGTGRDAPSQRHVSFQLSPEHEHAPAAVLELSNQNPRLAARLQAPAPAGHVPADENAAVQLHLREVSHQDQDFSSTPFNIHAATAGSALGAINTPAGAVNLDSAHGFAADPGTAKQPVQIVPLSSLPLGAVPDLPGSGTGSATGSSNKAHSKHHRHGKHLRDGSDGGSTAVSNATATSATSGVSKIRHHVEGNAEDFVVHINHPTQVTQASPHRQRVLAWLGHIGWCGKAVVYAMIGGLACNSAASDSQPPSVGQTAQVTASPQGAFVLLGTVPGGADVAMLIVMMLALVCYIAWRFGEAFRGQGYDKSFSNAKNFFKFRVSPAVSGAVYCSYLVFILQLLYRLVHHTAAQPARETWPATWRHSTGGKVGLSLMGLAFLIATFIQLQGVFSKQWHRDYREDLPPRVRTAVFATGHLGFAGRGAAFLALAILFFKDVANADNSAPHDYSMVANALLQLQSNRGLRAVLMIIGILLVIYGLFAVLSSWARQFPTHAPTRQRALPAEQWVQEQEAEQQTGQEAQHRNKQNGMAACERMDWRSSQSAATVSGVIFDSKT